MAAHYEAARQFQSNFDRIFAACEQAVTRCGFSLKQSDADNGRIAAKSSVNLLSWGETISIVVSPNGSQSHF